MTSHDFYQSAEDHNIVKTKLVTKYFSAWCSVILPRIASKGGNMAYVDLCSGPGRFEDGTESTPLWILRTAIKKPDIAEHLVTVFNDIEPKYIEQLRQEIQKIPDVENFKYAPLLSSDSVGPDLLHRLGGLSETPTLFFIDPWGYRGLSLELIGNAIRNWGCDCIFFFNYNRVNSGLVNRLVDKHMDDLYGATRATAIRNRLAKLTSSSAKEKVIIDELASALEEVGGKYVVPFRFPSDQASRTSHYVVFVTKHPLGFRIMKDVMESLSTDRASVKQFEFVATESPQTEFFRDFGRTYSIDALKQYLLLNCAGRTLSVTEAFELHTLRTPYTIGNVQTALLELESEELVTVLGSSKGRTRAGRKTLARDRLVTFSSTQNSQEAPHGTQFRD